MGDFLTLKDDPGQKDYGYVAKIENGGGEYQYGDIEYEIVLKGEGVISNGNWNNIVGDIVVYDMKEVYNDNRQQITLDSNFDWTKYIVFVFRATKQSDEIEVKYIDQDVFSPPKKEKKEEDKKKEKEKKEEDVKDIVLKAEPVSGQDNKYNLFFKFPNDGKHHSMRALLIKFNQDVQDFNVINEDVYEKKPKGNAKNKAGDKIFLIDLADEPVLIENNMYHIGTITVSTGKIKDYIDSDRVSVATNDSNGKDTEYYGSENVKTNF